MPIPIVPHIVFEPQVQEYNRRRMNEALYRERTEYVAQPEPTRYNGKTAAEMAREMGWDPDAAYNAYGLERLIDAYKKHEAYIQKQADIAHRTNTVRSNLSLAAQQKNDLYRSMANELVAARWDRDDAIKVVTPNASKIHRRLRKHADELKRLGYKDEWAELDTRLKELEGNHALRFAELGLDHDFSNPVIGKKVAENLLGEVEHQTAMDIGTARTLKSYQIGDQVSAALQKLGEQHKSPMESALTGLLSLLDLPMERLVNQPYYAWQLQSRNGGNSVDGLRAAVAALPMGQVLAGTDSQATSYAEAVNSREKRAALTSQKRLDSYGELAARSPFLANVMMFSGGIGTSAIGYDVKSQLERNPDAVPTIAGKNLSAAYDLFFNVFGDPTTYATLGASKLGKVGAVAGKLGEYNKAAELAADGGRLARIRAGLRPTSILDPEARGLARQEGRLKFLEGGRGRSLAAATEQALNNFNDPVKLGRALELPPDVAKRALDLKATKGLKAGNEVLIDAFVSGEFRPNVTLRRQALSAGAGAFGVERPVAIGARGIPLLLGNKPFKRGDGLTRSTLDWLARGKGATFARQLEGEDTATTHIIDRAPLFLKKGAKLNREGIRQAGGGANLSKARARTYRDFWQDEIESTVRDKTIDERFTTLLVDAPPHFVAEVEAAKRQLRMLPETPQGLAQKEELLRQLEFTRALLDGKAGKSARLMASAELQRNAPVAQSFKQLMAHSADGAGLTRRAMFGERMVLDGQNHLRELVGEQQRLTRLVAELEGYDQTKWARLRSGDGEARPIPELIANARKELSAVENRIRATRSDIKRFQAMANPFRVELPEEKAALTKPRSEAEIQRERAALRQEIPAAREALEGHLEFAKEAAILERKELLKELDPSLHSDLAGPEDERILKAVRGSIAQEVEDLRAGKLATPEMSDLKAQLDALDSPVNLVVRPTPMAEWELREFVERTGIPEAKVRAAERYGEERLYAALDRSEAQLQRLLFTEPDSPSFSPFNAYQRGEGAAYYRADTIAAAQDVQLYRTLLDRLGDRSHPLLAKATDLEHELKALKAQKGVVSKEQARIDRAMHEAGYGKSALKNTELNRTILRSRIEEIEDEPLRNAALEELDRLAGKGPTANLKPLAQQVTTLLHDERLREQAAHVLEYTKAAKAVPGRKPDRGPLGRLGAVLEPALAVLEPVAPSHIRFSSSPNPLQDIRNRADDLERVATSLHFDANTVREFVKAGVNAKSEEEVYRLLREMYAEYAIRQGVSPTRVLHAYKKHVGQHSDLAFDVDEATGKVTRSGKFKLKSAELKTGVKLQTQLINDIPVLDPHELRTIIRRIKADRGNVLSKARLVATDLGQTSVPFTKGKVSVVETFKSTHHFWKFAVVTNAPAIGLGVVGGALTGEDLEDRFKRAVLFGSIGALGSVRYLGRVVGVEERLIRYTAIRGLSPLEWVPGVAKAQRRLGVELPFRLADDIASSAHPLHHFETGRLVTVGDDWKALGQTDSRYIDGLYRIANYHIHPETDDLARMALQGKLGLLDGDWKVLAKDWLVNTEDGRLFWRRMKYAKDGPATIDKLVDNYDQFIEKYLPSDDLKLLRLSNADRPDGAITHDQLKKFLKEDPASLPRVVYAQDAWHVPKPWKTEQLKATWRQMFGRNVLETPTAKVNRLPLAEQIYKEEFQRLVVEGIDVQRARDIAETIAVDRTNNVMFRIADESRFAAKADYVAPFQQPREELARVYFRLVVDNKGRTMQMGRLGALAFNNGKEAGLFFEGEDGEWRMRVPGSARLSELFGSPAKDFDFAIRDAFFFLQGSAGSGHGFDPDADTFQLFQSVLPTPGGPFWTLAYRRAFDSMPWLEKELRGTWLWDRLFPFGSTGFLGRAEARRLFTAITGGVPFWEIANKEAAENEVHNRVQLLVNLRRYAHKDDPNYFPTNEEVMEDVKTFYTLWAAIGSVVPAPVRPTFAGKEDFERILSNYKERYKTKWFERMWEDHPEASAIWLSKRTTRRDGAPDDFEDWLKQANGISEKDYNNRYRRYFSIDEMRDIWKKQKLTQNIWDRYHEVTDAFYPNYADRAVAISKFKYEIAREHPEFNFNTSYEKKTELWRIMNDVPPEQRDAALNAWRQLYDISPNEYLNLKNELAVRGNPYNPWVEARSLEQINYEVMAARNKTGQWDDRIFVETMLTPAEQVMYWNLKQAELSYYGNLSPRSPNDDAGYVVDQWQMYQSKIGKLFADNPELRSKRKRVNPYDEYVNQLNSSYWDNIKASYAEIDSLSMAMDHAYKSKQYSTYRALRDRRNDAFARQRALINGLHNSVADIGEIIAAKYDLMALTGLVDPSLSKKRQEQALKNMQGAYREWGIDAFFVPFGEEAQYRQMNLSVRAAYIDDLYARLEADPSDHSRNLNVKAIRWSYLTDFQKEVLEKNLSERKIEAWKTKDENWEELSKGDRGGYRRRYYRRRRRSYYRGGDIARDSLRWAYSQFKLFNQRPAGAVAPAAYAEYIALPQDPGLRHKFLREHPEVGEWIKAGPLANMDPLTRLMVTNIMVTYGKWEGEPMDMSEVTELAFARYQLQKWNRRETDLPPETYDIWLQMPTGAEKAAYLQQHPEIGEWLRLGPMANMPDDYKEVIRDIMFRYGEWTQRQDPLGELITEFTKLPGYARKKFLADHPELVAYWNELKSPEERRMAEMVEGYFALTDAGARRMYLHAHPELNDYFVQARTKRYERFLNRVAQFMGMHPEMFESYLKRQTDVMTELVQRFAAAPLIREAPKVTSVSERSADHRRRRR